MMKSKHRKTLLAAALVAGGFVVATGIAHATPDIEFIGQNDLNFDCNSLTPPVGVGSFLSCSGTNLTWIDQPPVGDQGEVTSALDILAPFNGPAPIVSEAGYFDVGVLQHTNNVISGGGFSWLAENVLDNFSLNVAGGDVVFALTGTNALPPVPLTVDFTETPNVEGGCAAPNPVGSVCDDEFAITGLDLVVNDFAFTALGENWLLSFRAFAEVDAGTAVVGNSIYTAESETSILRIQAEITQVPVPGTLALLGLGLAGFAARRGIKNRKA
jgi:hypothetical protein